jgi:type 1 glutamine amidotransferase
MNPSKLLSAFGRLAAVSLAAALLTAPSTPAAAAPKIRVLLVTGGHGFEREPFFQIFKDNPQITFEAVEQPKAQASFEPAAGARYDVIVLYDFWQPITLETKTNFLARLQEGKGLVALHHCLANYQDWPEFARIIGGKYRLQRHIENGVEKPGSTYQHDVDLPVKIVDPTHPITLGLRDFVIHDETYGQFDVSPEVHRLLTTTAPTSGPVIGWTKTYGPARVAYLELGHDHQAYENPNYRKLIAQAIGWAAEPATPRPAPATP